MTHLNHQTNGASLEDCHTNFFALTDLSGIKWRKLVQGERPNASGDPLDDPVLRSYSRCLTVDILCVWRRVAAPKPDPDPSGGLFDISLSGPGLTGSVIHPPLSLTAAKELWIFWYGEEPDLSELVAPELLKSSEGCEQGAWETGLSYECRSLLFKALHNLIESCLLSRDVVRLGRWFVQPCSSNEKISGKSSHHFSFSFAFFVHGDLTVCASMDLREHPPVRPLSSEYLLEAEAQANNVNNDCKPKAVILAPFGLSATLTGQSYRGLDQATQKVLNDWFQFYPLCNRENSDLPPLVEVITGGVKMRYPSKYVLVTDIDDHPIINQEKPNSTASAGTTTTTSMNSPTTITTNSETPTTITNTITPSTITTLLPNINIKGNDLSNPLSMHLPQTSATLIPERVWQDCIMNPVQLLHDDYNNILSSSSLLANTATNTQVVATPTSSFTSSTTSTLNGENTDINQSQLWKFTDPTLKVSCICTKCKKLTGRSSSSTSSGGKSSSRTEKGIRSNRTPFHRRLIQETHEQLLLLNISSKKNNLNTLTTSTTNTPTTTTTTISSTANNNDSSNVALLSTTISQRSNCGYTQNGPPSYSRHPNSISESLPVPSVGSPASAGPSPLPNSTLSQPSSVPPSDQLLSMMSPHPPASIQNLQQPQTPIEQHIDKNTPASTPTDQNDNKSTTASPYQQMTPNIDVLITTTTPSTIEQNNVKNESGNNDTISNNINNNDNRNCVVETNSITANSSSTCNVTNNTNNSNINNNNNSNQINNLNNNNNVSGSNNINLNNIKNSNNSNTRNVNNNNNSNTNSKNNNNNKNINLNNNNNNSSNINNKNISNNLVSILKRPVLSSRDYENIIDDDYLPRQLLYDYSTWDAWMNHPVKRYKPNEEIKVNRTTENLLDLYAGQPPIQTYSQLPLLSISSPTATSVTMSSIARTDSLKSGELDTALLLAHEIKTEPFDGTGEVEGEGGKCPSGNLFTSEGLQVSFKDLEQIFDNSDDTSNDESIQVHTPPGSNKSVGGGGIDDNSKRGLGSCNPNTGILRPEELSKMFPTPPSLEHHPNSSPSGSGGLFDVQMNDISEGPKIKSDIYPNLGSPNIEPIDDWSYVFVLPSVTKFVGSSKYAPLLNLPSQSLPPLVVPSNIIYKQSWKQQQQHTNSNNNNNHNNQEKQQQLSHQQQQLQLPQPPPIPQQFLQQQPPQQSHSIPNTPRPISRPSSVNSLTGSSNILPNSGMQLSNNASMYSTIQQQQQQHHQMNINLRTTMSPISPVNASGTPFLGMTLSPHVNPFRRTPILPPPPYDLAVASPATSSTSSYLNKQFNSEEPTTPSIQRTPEANALLVNILLYDTSLNIFRDHNFDSCTLCVCNATPKCVGNIRGADSGVYLSLPGCNFNQPISYNNNNNNNNNNNHNGYNLDSPLVSSNSSNQTTGYLDEDPINCSCGFSAVVNRRLAHRSGLFYEDEMEITNVAEDPACHKKGSLLAYILGTNVKNENGSGSNAAGSNNNMVGLGGIIRGGTSSSEENCDSIPQTMMDLLREQCAIVKTSSSSIQRAVQRFKSVTTTHSIANKTLNVLEYTDANDVISLALEQSRIVFESNIMCKMEIDSVLKQVKSNISVHKWPFLKVNGPNSNQDIVRIMKSMQPLLQDAFHKKCTTRLWEAPYTVKGPLTWREFHRLAGRGTGQCEPQPIPTVIVGHEKDWLSVAPYAIHYWDKLLLEPYSYARDVAYIVVAPDNDYVVSRVKMYFKELSTTYEMCKLGRHTPIKGWDGILKVGKTFRSNTTSESLDEWFATLGDSKTSELLKLYAQVCQQSLVPYLSKVPLDRSLLDPPDSATTSYPNNPNKDRPLPSPMPPPNTPDSSQSSGAAEKAPGTPKSEIDDSQRDSNNLSAPTVTTEPLSTKEDDDKNPPSIVIYVVEPFTYGSDSPELQRIACLALLRVYSNILNAVPDSIRSSINFQIISQESIMELSCNRNRLRLSDEMRCLALSVFSQCRRYLGHTNNVKSLTGFGTAANVEQFLKTKDEKNRSFYKLYTPPYILATQSEKKGENTESFGITSIEQQCSVMYCSYCLSEDQSWLLAVATDDRGELLETVTINIDIPNRSRRKKASARRLGLQKLMDFILGVISQSVQPWRLVVGRIGRIGHGELKGWSWLLSKQNLLKASKQLKDICEQCSLMYPHSVPSILSACLVTLEPDSNLRVMPDQFTPDERFSQISMQSPLSTPQDVTCTHILVFPTSAVTQSSQTAFQEQHIHGLEIGDDALFCLADDEGMEDMASMNGLENIFDGWDGKWEVQMPQASPEHNSRQGSPNGMEDNRNRQSPQGGTNCGNSRNGNSSQDAEEVGQLLQQPLALGYLVSTAPTGRMPSWFWASCPHLENVCPVFLKTALHLHSPAIQQNTDDILQQNQSSGIDHPLDSQFTADVLRYVLEGYNVLSWLAMDTNTQDRLSCLPIHVQLLMQLYHMTAALA